MNHKSSNFSSEPLKAFCKVKARPQKNNDEEEEDVTVGSFIISSCEEGEESGEDECSMDSFLVSSCEEGDGDEEEEASGASDSQCVGVSDFCGDEAMEEEASGEEWEESEEEAGGNFILDEAEDEDDYQARKRRAKRDMFSSDDMDTDFCDDEAMEEGASSEEWEEGDEGEAKGNFILDEAEDEDNYQARKRRVKRDMFSSDDTDTDSNSKRLVPGPPCNTSENVLIKKKRKGIVSVEEEEVEDEEQIAISAEDGEEGGGSHGDNVEEEENSVYSSCSTDDNEPAIGGSHGSQTSSRKKKVEHFSDGHLKWKMNLASKATAAHKRRARSSGHLGKLIYSDQTLPTHTAQEEEEEEESLKEGMPVIGGLFQLTKKKSLTVNHLEDSSILSNIPHSGLRDWSSLSTAAVVKSLFVTGDWGADSARALLNEDEMLYGDFEDLETGEKRKRTEEELEEERNLVSKKKKLKKEFDVQYDEEGGTGYLEDLKREVSEQEQRNKAEFEGVDARTRLQLEGICPGHYVRMELKGLYVGRELVRSSNKYS